MVFTRTNGGLTMKTGIFTLNDGGFSMRNGGWTTKHGDLSMFKRQTWEFSHPNRGFNRQIFGFGTFSGGHLAGSDWVKQIEISTQTHHVTWFFHTFPWFWAFSSHFFQRFQLPLASPPGFAPRGRRAAGGAAAPGAGAAEPGAAGAKGGAGADAAEGGGWMDGLHDD